MESAELGLLKNMLEEAGIRCALRNEQLSQALPEAPFNVELWVESDDDFRGREYSGHLANYYSKRWIGPPAICMY